MYGRDLLRYLGRKNRSIDLCFCWDSDNDDEEDDDGCQSNRLLNENAATTNEDMTLMENVMMKAKQRADLSRRLCLIRFDYDYDGIRMLLLDLELKFDEIIVQRWYHQHQPE